MDRRAGQDDGGFPFAQGGGRMAERVRAFDWASTSLGPPAAWPPELKGAVGFILECRFPNAVLCGPELLTIYNDAFGPILGDKPEALGRPFREVWAEVWDEIGPIAARALAGEATYIEDLPLEIDRSGRSETANFTFCYAPLRLADGSVFGVVDTVVETTDAVRARTRLKLSNEELGHRIKNTLAMVQAIAGQTLKDATPREAVDAFRDRLAALGRAHDQLLGRVQTAASLRVVAEATFAPLDGFGQIIIDGPDVHIGSRTTMALALLLNELATNSTKYGALSGTGGRVSLFWTTADDRLRLYWRESGGPTVHAPPRLGFGTRLIDMGLAADGAVSRRYPATGLEVDVEAPLARLQD